MKKVIGFFIGVALSTTSLAFAQEIFTVQGSVIYSTEANIYVCLHTKQSFSEWKKTLPPGSFTQTVKTTPSGKADFKFEDVPKGEYMIIAFVDQNGNGRLDCDTWGFPHEPYLTAS